MFPLDARDPAAVHSRWGTNRDLPSILAIDAAAYGRFAWTEADYLTSLRRRTCILMVLERGYDIIAVAVYELSPAGLTLLRFAVAPSARRTGDGRALVAKLVYKLCSHRRSWLRVTVPESMTDAHRFFKASGFRAVAVTRGEFWEPAGHEEDGYVFEYRATDADYARVGRYPAPVSRGGLYGE